jgi:uncharacterized membrane protein (UPF0136 family)
MNLLPLIPIAYGILSLIGGIMGYAKAKSLISLISGGGAGVLLILFGFLMPSQSWAQWGAIAIVILLVVTFIVRLFKTRKAMPAILMIVTGIPALIILLSA